MGLEVYLRRFKALIAALIFGCLMVLSGCAPVINSAAPSSLKKNQDNGGREKNAEQQGLSPRALAALQLTEQGRMFLENKQPDDAIGILERALNLNPDNGRNYYYLAEAWLMKGNIGQAAQFNRLANIYLKDDNEWLQRVILQRERIAEKLH
ncbi:MAG: tetratricopeptide repeat protein [Desulfobacterales bacterium]